ncbi:protein ABA AND ROS SENSITIVE 1 [Impatiens glandulifera]|uniref:protein ABA AND ROS SENSITIVE 1 n=1 Tax=Impatiens glandulifera TaxID=253017 RepID=UPI001FB13691|nr:protein ABA AND ROS SENSITIVE 1 [Impatiens glandulifera]
MDLQARKKAVYRAKLNAHKSEKRIESPLVRYNESDQPVCRVCDITLKSESSWPAHQASRKHHEAIENVKANAAGHTRVKDKKTEPSKELPTSKLEQSKELPPTQPESSSGVPKARSSASLPSDFFDNSETKKQKTGTDPGREEIPVSSRKAVGHAQAQVTKQLDSSQKVETPTAKFREREIEEDKTHTSKPEVVPNNNQVKGPLPEGFFDDKDSDLRARGITPVKPDVKDEYKEFEKLIQEDLKEVDNRMEEEEIDAAEMIEEAESVEQKVYWERVERLKKKKMELAVARSSDSRKRAPENPSPEEEASSGDESDDDFTVDWRAKRI